MAELSDPKLPPLCRGAVEFDDYGPTSQSLACPNCAQGYLHHGTVRVFDREREDSAVIVMTVESQEWQDRRADPNARSNPPAPLDCGNPSARRNGIAIAFECEHCDARLELTIAQHKGATLVEWRYRED
jgi:hypothetical protein